MVFAGWPTSKPDSQKHPEFTFVRKRSANTQRPWRVLTMSQRFANQQFDKRDANDRGLTTADLANANERSATTYDMDHDFSAEESTIQRSSFRNPALSTDVHDAGIETDTNARSNEDDTATPLFSPEESNDFYARWTSVQVSFVDEPRQAVQQADGLVAGAMKRLAEIFAEERARLDGQWDRGDSVSTEDLRLALRRYRSFFGRLLSI